MSFDYRLREGIATSRNAIRLMKLIGIPIHNGAPAPLSFGEARVALALRRLQSNREAT